MGEERIREEEDGAVGAGEGRNGERMGHLGDNTDIEEEM